MSSTIARGPLHIMSACHRFVKGCQIFNLDFTVQERHGTVKSLLSLIFYFVLTESVISDPCVPNPCGSNTICRAAGTVAHCSCRPPMSQDPPSCKPECRADGECPLDRACRNSKCRDPCPGACGAHALCQVRQHSAICTCPPKYVGDPFVRCTPGK